MTPGPVGYGKPKRITSKFPHMLNRGPSDIVINPLQIRT
jgi:hypothetical protein